MTDSSSPGTLAINAALLNAMPIELAGPRRPLVSRIAPGQLPAQQATQATPAAPSFCSARV